MTTDCTTVPESEWVPPHPGVALSPAVTDAAGRWRLTTRVERVKAGLRVYMTCADCDQAILPLVVPAGVYGVRITDISAQLIAHLIVRHGWTREAPRGE